MRIAIYHNQPSGGAKRTLYEIGRRLSKRHTVDVYILNAADESFLDSKDYANQVLVYPYQRRHQPRLGMYLNDWRSYRDLVNLDTVNRRVAAAINQGGYSIAYVDACRYLQSPFLLRYLSIPSAYFCHEPPRRYTEPMCRPAAAPLSPFERMRLVWRWPTYSLLERYSRLSDRRNVSHASLILTNSRHTQAKIREAYKRESVVCPLGVDSLFFVAGEKKKGYVLSVGALEPHKGFEFLVRALARCSPQVRPALHLVCNTDHSALRRHLERLARELGVSVLFHIRVSDTELLSLYQAAMLFLYAPYNEPFGLAPWEAMACGTPVVAVAEGGVPESITSGRTGLLVGRDEGEFARAVESLLLDEDLRERFGAAARAAAVDRSWERTANHIEALLEQL